ncbi:hypothetical protein PIB30_118892 [Stylosanthes scabra]|uniref:Uncharacterized protein n=1 Tax=Stylosanthes scabra TaxID=79078 RepID=A0ABU6ZLR0_9FABA|nr:hypothetical protein [Stylosanthes scabra]
MEIPPPSQNQDNSTFTYQSTNASSSTSTQQNNTRAQTPPPPPPSFHNPTALMAVPASVADSSWYPDTGASHHITPDASNLLTSSDYTGQDQVQIGNGTVHKKWFCYKAIGMEEFTDSLKLRFQKE